MLSEHLTNQFAWHSLYLTSLLHQKPTEVNIAAPIDFGGVWISFWLHVFFPVPFPIKFPCLEGITSFLIRCLEGIGMAGAQWEVSCTAVCACRNQQHFGISSRRCVCLLGTAFIQMSEVGGSKLCFVGGGWDPLAGLSGLDAVFMEEAVIFLMYAGCHRIIEWLRLEGTLMIT